MNYWIERGGRNCPTLNIAHRGASAYAPENTVVAFRLAAELGAQAIELDVHLSRDGRLVVCHDADVSRTTNGSGVIHNLDLATLRSLDAGYRFSQDTESTPFRGKGLRIPTLSEVFAAIPNSLLVNVEVKATLYRPTDPSLRHFVVRALARWLDDHAEQGLRERVLLSSFDWSLVDAVRDAELDLPTAYLISPGVNLQVMLEAASAAKHSAIHPHESLITEQSRATLAHARALDIAVNVWTVDDANRMHELLELGVDGIVTNRPDVLEKTR